MTTILLEIKQSGFRASEILIVIYANITSAVSSNVARSCSRFAVALKKAYAIA